MALHLTNADDRFVIYGPVIMNSEVLAYKGNIENIRRLGISQKREHIKKLTKEKYPQIKEIKEMNPEVLPYSLENNQIDAAVIDITKATLLPKFDFASISKYDYISYCLIVRKDLIGTDVFNNFLTIYNQAADELNQVERLVSGLGMPREFWKQVNIRFLKLYD